MDSHGSIFPQKSQFPWGFSRQFLWFFFGQQEEPEEQKPEKQVEDEEVWSGRVAELELSLLEDCVVFFWRLQKEDSLIHLGSVCLVGDFWYGFYHGIRPHQTPIWENIFGSFSKHHLKQIHEYRQCLR